MGTKCFIAVGEFSVKLFSLPNFNGLHCKSTKIALFIYLIKYWVDYMTSSVISFAYFKHFSNLNIFGTVAGICKRQAAFSFFHRILCDKPKKSRGKNLIIVAL